MDPKPRQTLPVSHYCWSTVRVDPPQRKWRRSLILHGDVVMLVLCTWPHLRHLHFLASLTPGAWDMLFTAAQQLSSNFRRLSGVQRHALESMQGRKALSQQQKTPVVLSRGEGLTDFIQPCLECRVSSRDFPPHRPSVPGFA